ncbi:MAG: GTPase Era [Microcystis aeruginosa L111-01]|jgi:GTP-binding protein Era|nr:GTPase Era [Microcystis aeruginosa L111-01]NCS44934.1 GTPase Era [Microcystis aeruginosa BS11-05]
MNDFINSQAFNLDSAVIPVAPTGFKSGFIGIIGRPNVGKSTLMNQLVGQKIAITSPIAQTTRNRLRGIVTGERSQMIFVDTPGIHKPHHELGKVLVKNAENAINSVDLVLFVVDSSNFFGSGDRYIADLLTKNQTPTILGLNKADQQPEDLQPLDDSYRALGTENNWPLLKFSALEGTGIEALQNLLIDSLEVGPYYYPPDLVTDQPERFIMGELIREQILRQTRQEIPHSVAVVIERVEETPALTKVFAAINVERDSQKGIVIGKNGSMLKAIGTSARSAIQKLIAGEVYLKLFVKVEPKWRQSRSLLAEFGYRTEE